MKRTLFYIPHEVWGVPVFGVGWLLAIWVLLCACMAFRSWRRGELASESLSLASLALLIGAVIVFILPMLEESWPSGEVPGLPIRGYGVFLMAGVLSGVLLAAFRSQKAGLHPDVIYALAMSMCLAGIAGARMFFVIEYWEQFQRETIAKTLVEIARFTEGGLVVYGSLIGALTAFFVFCRLRRLPWLAVGDIIAPSMALGLALGRIGCLMNGCCYGDFCEVGPALQFPDGSPAYLRQLEDGDLLGLALETGERGKPRRVREVEPNSLAARSGIEPGERIVIRWAPIRVWNEAQAASESATPLVSVESSSGKTVSWTRAELPARSLPVYPTQVYSAINAFLLFLLLLAFDPLRRRDGMTLALALTLYPVSRFLLERIRIDEAPVGATSLTISQWVSVFLLLGAAVLWALIYRRGPGRADLQGRGAKTNPGAAAS